jgi:hypothetical protein
VPDTGSQRTISGRIGGPGGLLSIGADGSVVLGTPGASEPLAVAQAPGAGIPQAAVAAARLSGTETASLVASGASVTPAGGGTVSPAVSDSAVVAAVAAPTPAVAPAAVDRVLAAQPVPGVVLGLSTPFVPQGMPPNCRTCSLAGPGWPSALRTITSGPASDAGLLRFVEARAGNAAARAGNQQPATGLFGLDLPTLDLLAGGRHPLWHGLLTVPRP